MTEDTRVRLLALLLRFAAVFLCSAFLAMLLPVEWMAATHEAIGLGEFPRVPVVEYLARSIAALYGFHGVLLLIIASDPRRYRSLVWYVAAMNVVLGVMLVLIDLDAGMPLWWTLVEGPPIFGVGIVVALLNRSIPAGR